MNGQIAALMLSDAFWSGIAAVGFAVLFNVPPRLLVYCLLTGALGHSFRAVLEQVIGLNIVPATFAAAIVVGFVSFILARRLKAPSLIFSVTGVIPMVPGKVAYTAMIALVAVASGDGSPVTNSELIHTALANLIQTGMILGALGLGIATPALLLERAKPVV